MVRDASTALSGARPSKRNRNAGSNRCGKPSPSIRSSARLPKGATNLRYVALTIRRDRLIKVMQDDRTTPPRRMPAPGGLCWSGRGDLNPRPPEPHSGTLPGCATARRVAMLAREQRPPSQQSRPPQNQVARDLDVLSGRRDHDLFDLVRLCLEVFADGVELAVPGLLDHGDLFHVVDFAHGLLGVGHGGGLAAGDVVEHRAPGEVHVLRHVLRERLVLVDLALVALGALLHLVEAAAERPLEALGLVVDAALRLLEAARQKRLVRLVGL